MKLVPKTLVAAAVVALATTGAQAALNAPTTGDGSLMFVAIDSTGAPISLTIDLGYTMSQFLPGTSLTDAGSTVVWDFKNNTRKVDNGAAQTGFSWSAGLTDFFATAQAGQTTWGVLAGDSTSTLGDIAGRGWLATGNPTLANITNTSTSSPVGNALGNLTNFTASVNNSGTHVTDNDGAGTAVSGGAYLGTTMKTNFGGNQTWSYLTATNATSRFQFLNLGAGLSNPTVQQYGATGIDVLATAQRASTFAFNADAGTLTFTAAAVPEPSTYAMLLAGLAAIGSMVRRRKS